MERTTVSVALAKARQILIDHGLESTELDTYICELNRRAVLKGSVLDGAPVVDTTDVNRAKDQRRGTPLLVIHARSDSESGLLNTPSQ